MTFKVVHIVSSLQRINFGIWNAAIFGAKNLLEKHKVETLALICTSEQPIPAEMNIPVVFCHTITAAKAILSLKGFDPASTIIVSHGSWLMPTRVGYMLKLAGYKWIYAPHGMLEPWSLNHQQLKKTAYWLLRERWMVKHADVIRAVSKTEQQNLGRKLHRQIAIVENGVVIPAFKMKSTVSSTYLFMARLHHKKGIRPLVEAWQNINGRDDSLKLIIAGPDEGELDSIRPFIRGNIEYVGPAYGDGKVNLLNSANYYVLPSYSEGFPTSVLEAMSYGAIPIISTGCNFPEIFKLKLGYEVEPDVAIISNVLQNLKDIPVDSELPGRNRTYVSEHYSEEKITDDLYKLYSLIADR